MSSTAVNGVSSTAVNVVSSIAVNVVSSTAVNVVSSTAFNMVPSLSSSSLLCSTDNVSSSLELQMKYSSGSLHEQLLLRIETETL